MPNDDPRWREECATRWYRVLTMRAMSIHARRTTLAEVERKEGALARERLEVEYQIDWRDRKATP